MFFVIALAFAAGFAARHYGEKVFAKIKAKWNAAKGVIDNLSSQ